MLQERCQRCGRCCRNGGPALHTEDHGLYQDGVLGKHHLLTLRAGEWVYDNVRGCVEPTVHEVVRIGAQNHTPACVFYDQAARACTIYAHRPVECRTLDCQSPEKLEAMYTRDRLTRFELVAPESGLGELMAWHEQACGYARVAELCQQLRTDEAIPARQALAEMLRQDIHLRESLQEKCDVGQRALAFLFGRPLTATLPAFGFRPVFEGEQVRFLAHTAMRQ